VIPADQTQGSDARRVDLNPDNGAHSAGKLDRQRSQPWTDLDDVIRWLEVESLHHPFQLPSIGEEGLPPASLKANAKAAGDPAND